METLQINNIEHLLKYINDSIGEQMTHNWIGSIVDDNIFKNGCKSEEAEKHAIEDYYEGTLLCAENEGYIKLNISKEEIYNALWNIYANDPMID